MYKDRIAPIFNLDSVIQDNPLPPSIAISRLTIPNFLSIMRIPLALIFLQSNPFFRFLSIVLAGCTDMLDGYIARRYRLSSKLGALLDPLTDKFFVFFVLAILIKEGHLEWWQVGALLCRDFALLLFASYLFLRGRLTQYKVRAFWCGKIVTSMQFLILSGLSLGIGIPDLVFAVFPLLGGLALFELYFFHNTCFSAR